MARRPKDQPLAELPGDLPCKATALIGHTEHWRQLTGAFETGRGGQGYILAGPTGIGKATFAFQAARRLLAQSETESGVPDDKTARLIAGLAHPDLLVLNSDRGADSAPLISVDEVRRAVQFLTRTAAGDGRRVVIIDKADHLNRAAGNALLKALEEPPSGAVLFLVCDVPGRLLPTLRSRCQTMRFDPLSAGDTASVFDSLEARGASPGSRDQAELAIGLAGGSPGLALTLLKQDLSDLLARIDQWFKAAGNAGAADAQQLAAQLAPRSAHRAASLAFDRIRMHLHHQARQQIGEGGTPEDAAALWQDMTVRQRDIETYNLDRQAFFIDLLQKAIHAGGGTSDGAGGSVSDRTTGVDRNR
jgi:DNA polymerase-3 subunit delta'